MAYTKYRISRRGRKLQIFDDQRTLVALPKDVPERTWAEILQKEENELIVFEIREELLDDALRIGYQHYMERQNALFTAHCAAQAWLKIIDWQFYRHDPGEEPSAYPPCYIPKRVESWIPDEIPDPSPKDTWCSQHLTVVEDTPDELVQKWPSSSSLDLPVVEDIPVEYWFPGKVMLYGEDEKADDARKTPQATSALKSGLWSFSEEEEKSETRTSETSENLGTESEVLQKVTDYSTEGMSKGSTYSALKTTSPMDGSLHGAGDSTVIRPRRRLTERMKGYSRASVLGRSKGTLPPLDVGDSRSRISIISDCRLRNLRLDTQYEISSERVDTPLGETGKRK